MEKKSKSFLAKNPCLNLLWEVSKALKPDLPPQEIVNSLTAAFSSIFALHSLKIFIYESRTKTFKDFTKSWAADISSDVLNHLKSQFDMLKNQEDRLIFNEERFNVAKIFEQKSAVFQKLVSSENHIILPIKNKNRLIGLLRVEFERIKPSDITVELLVCLEIVSNQISAAIMNSILSEHMKNSIKFHEAMKNIAKIIETQYEWAYIIPIVGEMIDRFISEHLIYVFLKSEGKSEPTGDEKEEFTLIWPTSCADKSIKTYLKNLTRHSKEYILEKEGKVGLFPLRFDKKLAGCIVAYNRLKALSKTEIDYLNQLANQTSITLQRANAYAQVLQHATLDALTGLNNRHQFQVRFSQEVSLAKRRNTPLCCMIIDVDFFKNVNDTYGHAVGDCVLKNLAVLIQKELRESDIASRYGGEEFCIILPQTSLEEAYLVAQRLRKSVEQTSIDIRKFKIEGKRKINITISIGVNAFNPKKENAEDFFQDADKALYDAKHAGRNRVMIFSEA